MATECNNAPFINQNFYITGYWGEPRATHIHAGFDLSTGGINNVYNMYDGYVIDVNPTGAGSGYGPNIIIQSLDGMTWLYGDLSPFSGFSVGDHVLQGQYIATEGNPAGTSSTGYHVHIELEYLQYGQSFKYGYENSSNPGIPLGLPNQEGGPYIFYGTPIPPTPPTPSGSSNTKKWLYFKKRKMNVIN